MGWFWFTFSLLLLTKMMLFHCKCNLAGFIPWQNTQTIAKRTEANKDKWIKRIRKTGQCWWRISSCQFFLKLVFIFLFGSKLLAFFFFAYIPCLLYHKYLAVHLCIVVALYFLCFRVLCSMLQLLSYLRKLSCRWDVSIIQACRVIQNISWQRNKWLVLVVWSALRSVFYNVFQIYAC